MKTRAFALLARLVIIRAGAAARLRAAVAGSGPANLLGVAGVVVLDATIAEQWGRLAGQGFAGVVLVWVCIVLSGGAR